MCIENSFSEMFVKRDIRKTFEKIFMINFQRKSKELHACKVLVWKNVLLKYRFAVLKACCTIKLR